MTLTVDNQQTNRKPEQRDKAHFREMIRDKYQQLNWYSTANLDLESGGQFRTQFFSTIEIPKLQILRYFIASKTGPAWCKLLKFLWRPCWQIATKPTQKAMRLVGLCRFQHFFLKSAASGGSMFVCVLCMLCVCMCMCLFVCACECV